MESDSRTIESHSEQEGPSKRDLLGENDDRALELADIEAKVQEEKPRKEVAEATQQETVRPPEIAKRSCCQKFFDFW